MIEAWIAVMLTLAAGWLGLHNIPGAIHLTGCAVMAWVGAFGELERKKKKDKEDL